MANSLMDAALAYIAEGFKVFPCRLDKKPMTEHGLKDATQLQIGVKDYWTKYPDASIGLLTDGFIVVDFDSKSGGKESKARIEQKYGKLPHTRTHRTGGGGLHYLYLNPNNSKVGNTVKVGGFEGVDLRANGGYIVVPPSPHPSGKKYELIDPGELTSAPDWLMELINIKTPKTTISSGSQSIPEGQRNTSLTSLGGTMRKKGMSQEAIEAGLLAANLTQCNPPLPEEEVKGIAKSVSRYQPEELQVSKYTSRVSQSNILQWIGLTSGAFNVRQIWAELNIKSPEDKNYLRVILKRFIDTNVICKTSTDGVYRMVDTEKKTIDWENADINNVLNIQLPFDIHKLCKIYPKSIIVVAGSKNEGKTAFLTSCLMPNATRFILDFYNSETGAEQLKMRLAPLSVPSPAPFNTYERYDNFADVIEPTHLSVIDYLDFNSEVYMVGAEIDAIFRKLTTGAAIIGLQKPPPSVTYFKGTKKVIDRDLAYGGGFSAKRAVVYISLSSHKLKLVYVKIPANPRNNPNGMTWLYDFDDNGYFTNIRRFYPDTEDSNDTPNMF